MLEAESDDRGALPERRCARRIEMPEPVQHFKYAGPNAEGGRDAAPGRKSFPMAQTDNVVSTVQIFEKGVHNNLHLHLVEDGYWIVLGGRARFHGEGDT